MIIAAYSELGPIDFRSITLAAAIFLGIGLLYRGVRAYLISVGRAAHRADYRPGGWPRSEEEKNGQ